MQKRKLGRSGLEVAPLAFGGNVFGWTADEPTSFRLLDGFVDAGFNLVDTADVYARWAPGNHGGESETIIGRWIRQSGKRNKVLIATKAGMEMGPGRKGLSRAYLFRAIEDSLKRLQVETIDLYQAHKDDPETPLEETLSALADLIKQGKVRAIGASNYSADRLAATLKISREKGLPRFETLQPLYNLYEREPFEKELEPLCVQNQLGVISYYSLARGFLTGKYRSEQDLSKSPRGGGIAKFLDPRGKRILAALDDVAKEHRATPAQVSLAWLIARPSVTAPIASATSLEQLHDLMKGATLQLSPAAIEKLDQASAY
ncbi:MAG TPA: aldo/keto reductase [Tepidisphaeraceae bacterium]|nr:aldo/keto reductase [Tepidisphaeraceae bacterium]